MCFLVLYRLEILAQCSTEVAWVDSWAGPSTVRTGERVTSTEPQNII